jgi:ribonuclease Z
VVPHAPSRDHFFDAAIGLRTAAEAQWSPFCMKRFKTYALLLGLVMAAGAALAWWQRGAIGLHLMAAQVSRITAIGDRLAALPDGLHIGLCGAGSPLPDERRAGPCTLVVAGRRMFVFDAGSGAPRNIVRMGFSVGQVEALFLTHYHSDHIDGVGELLLQHWAQGAAEAPLPVYGPPGLDQVLQGFRQVYALDSGYRVAHHGEKVVPPSGFGSVARPFEMARNGRQVLVTEDDLEIVAFAVEHDPVDAAVGYRIRYKDRTVVLSGDTRRCAAVERESRGVDVLLHEALQPAMVGMLQDGFAKAGRGNLAHIMNDIGSYHTTPEQAAEIAHAAGVKALVFSHIIPPLPVAGLDAAFLQDADKVYRGALHVGVDGDWISLPAGSTKIEMGRRP